MLNSLSRIFLSIRIWLHAKFSSNLRTHQYHRQWLVQSQHDFSNLVFQESGGSPWKPNIVQDATAQPFLDLLNRPAGGHAYCGGVVFSDKPSQPTLHHYRGTTAIDTPLYQLYKQESQPLAFTECAFWCGPLVHHFGHQVADFASRLLLSSIDYRSGELLWYPWKTPHHFDELPSWQKFLLNYLNPGHKIHRICLTPLHIKKLIIFPQQARMRAAPTLPHLEALTWCQRSLPQYSHRVVYASRTRFSPCTSAETLLGSFAGEVLFENFLRQRGVKIIYPETISLEHQLAYYRGADVLIFAEGSSQHCLELLGFNPEKVVIVICRRLQQPGMELPLFSRFPQVHFEIGRAHV